MLLADTTKVKTTARGMVKVKDLRVGDVIEGPNGRHRVTAVGAVGIGLKTRKVKPNRNEPAKTPLTSYMENAIFKYESDTFSASQSRITREEARLIANRINRSLVRDGHHNFDGVNISNLLYLVRRS
jgi:hypothetical protein